MLRFFPFSDLKKASFADLKVDFMSGLTLLFLGLPQGVAYALIAGLPPKMGLYAAALPAIIGSLFRSSSHVISGPTNAISLLMGGSAVLQLGLDPVVVAVTTAFWVGFFQLCAGWLRLGRWIDWVSTPVVIGYITGAASLIAIGQLPNLTATSGSKGSIVNQLIVWFQGLGGTSFTALTMGVSTLLLILALRHMNRRWPGPMIALTISTLISYSFSIVGLPTVSDNSPIPAGFPPFTMPDFTLSGQILSLALAATLLSLVESSSVGRAIAGRTGQRLDPDVEFSGQGLSNLSAAFTMGYPVSGSLARSALNESSGAKTRMAGVFSGLLMLAALLALGPIVDHTPLAALAGLLCVIAFDLIDMKQIVAILKTSWSDASSFLITAAGTWLLPLDQAIGLGIALSILFSMIDRRRSIVGDHHMDSIDLCRPDYRLFFGNETRFRRDLNLILDNSEARRIVLDLSDCITIDYTVCAVISETSSHLISTNRSLQICGANDSVRRALLGGSGLKATGQNEN